MKRTKLLNAEVSYLIARMGHKDSLVIGDAGLPVPVGVQKIDLAVSAGIPDFMSVFKAVLSEQRIEKVFLAEEIKTKNDVLHEKILEQLVLAGHSYKSEIEIVYIPHEEFKQETQKCMGAVRTGEFTPYANIILVSGVVF